MTRPLSSRPLWRPEHGASHPVDVDELSQREGFLDSLTHRAHDLGRTAAEVKAEAVEFLHAMDTAIDPAMNASWMRLGRWLLVAAGL